ncbi:ATP-binding protein [Lachnospiraceae bacterium ZAX-1]
MLKNFSLKIKIFVLVLAVVVVSFAILTASVFGRTYEMAKTDAFNLADETADKYKNEIIAELQGARITSETLATVFETLKDHELTDRDMMNDILKNALAKKEYITAFCIAYDPNALDGLDAQYTGNSEAYDKTGRYAPYWNKLGGNIAVEPLYDIDIADWYIVPKEERHEYITDPYPYEVQGHSVMLASLVFPILHNDKFIGIISSDIVLDKLQEMVSKVTPHGQEGYTKIFSNAGVVVAHPDKMKLGLDLEEAYPELSNSADEIKDAIKNGKEYISVSDDYYTVYMPIQFSQVTNPWSVAVSIPMTKVLKNADDVRNFSIIVSVIAICVIAAILYLIAISITKPIIVLSNISKTIGEGNFDIDVPLIEGNNEIGTLSTVFKYMVAEINKTFLKLNSALEAANVASEAKSFFLANMSHEIRTPLNAVIGLNQMLLATPLNDRQKDYLEKMRRASGSLLGIVNNILDFSKIETGEMELDVAPFDIRQMFDDLAILFEAQNAHSVIELRFELSPSLPTTLLGDRLRLQQVFINVMDNAYKFTQSGSITVRVDVSDRSQNGMMIDFTVEDTGIGMNEAQMNKIFSAFSQVDNTSTRKYGGTGLGLALTQQVIKLMGGKISVSSEVGKGTCFTFSCPFEPAEDTEGSLDVDGKGVKLKGVDGKDVKPKDADVKDDGDNAVLQGMRVLLVEDNEINIMIATELLDNVGIDVTIAENGKEALERLDEAYKKGKLFDLVLMDLQMPIMDGYEATIAIKAMPEYKSMPIYALTAHAFLEEQQRCLDIGMKEHLTKPIEIDKFYAALREVVTLK